MNHMTNHRNMIGQWELGFERGVPMKWLAKFINQKFTEGSSAEQAFWTKNIRKIQTDRERQTEIEKAQRKVSIAVSIQ